MGMSPASSPTPTVLSPPLMSPPSRLPRLIILLPRPLPTLLHLSLLPPPPSLLPPLPTSSTRGRLPAPLPLLVPVPSALVLEPSRPLATGVVYGRGYRYGKRSAEPDYGY